MSYHILKQMAMEMFMKRKASSQMFLYIHVYGALGINYIADTFPFQSYGNISLIYIAFVFVHDLNCLTLIIAVDV